MALTPTCEQPGGSHVYPDEYPSNFECIYCHRSWEEIGEDRCTA